MLIVLLHIFVNNTKEITGNYMRITETIHANPFMKCVLQCKNVPSTEAKQKDLKRQTIYTFIMGETHKHCSYMATFFFKVKYNIYCWIINVKARVIVKMKQ